MNETLVSVFAGGTVCVLRFLACLEFIMESVVLRSGGPTEIWCPGLNQ